MNQKEVRELRRRWTSDKTAVTGIYGYYINAGTREIIAQTEESLGLMGEEEQEKYLSLLRRCLSGTLGKNLLDVSFTTEAVREGEEQALLSALCASGLKDETARMRLVDKLVETVEQEEENYLILLAAESYDVPWKSKDDTVMEDASETVFRYFLCAVCPVKGGKVQLGYDADLREFHTFLPTHTVSSPEFGFMYPAFDGRRSNIYGALYYVKGTETVYPEIIDALFRTEPPLAAGEQKQCFETLLAQSLREDCSMEVVQSVNQQLRDMLSAHKEAKESEPLTLTAGEMASVLVESGVPEEKARSFCGACDDSFGADPILRPENLIDTRTYSVSTPQIKITLAPENSWMIRTETIEGRKYILIPADEEVEVNGIPVQ